MRVAVISDTHFGDPHGVLVRGQDAGVESRLGVGYPALRDAIGEVDYLVLLGDILDFSTASYERAYRDARAFFRAVQRDRLAREIIYVPGNHDFDIWHTVEHQVNIINQLKQGQLPRTFKRTVPGIIDDRASAAHPFILPDVTARPEWHRGHDYGNLFFDHITRVRGDSGPSGEKLNFSFAYPNLYLVTDDSRSILLTHGHYFEAYWSIVSEIAQRFAGDDLVRNDADELSLRDMVGMNLPLSHLACAGIGQAEPLTDLSRRIHLEIVHGDVGSVRKYLDRVEHELRHLRGLSFLRRRLFGWLFAVVKSKFLNRVRTLEQTRYSGEFLRRPSVRARFQRFFSLCLREIERLEAEYGLEIPRPSHVVFGHTHQPIPWGSEELVDVVHGRGVRLCNLGGWLLHEKGTVVDFPGAEVVLYESGVGLRSISIRGRDLIRSATIPETVPTPERMPVSVDH